MLDFPLPLSNLGNEVSWWLLQILSILSIASWKHIAIVVRTAWTRAFQHSKKCLFKKIFDFTSHNNHLCVVIGTDLCNRYFKKRNKFKMTREERCSFLSIQFSKYPPIFVGTRVEIVLGWEQENMVLVLSHIYYVTLGKTQHLPGSLFKFEMENKNVHPT